MVGLPSEGDEDILELIELIQKLKKLYPKIEITLSLNTFIPKAHTPLERSEALSSFESKKRMQFIKKQLLKTAKIRVSSSKWDYIQAVLSRGDRRLHNILVKFYEYGSSLGSFNRAFKDLKDSLPSSDWYALRKRPVKETLPWQHIVY